MNDQELLQKITAKDQNAFKELVDRFQSLVFHTCFNLIGNREHAEDVAQEVFLQIYKTAKKFRHECKLSTWIYRISVNRALNFIRDNRKFRWLQSIDSFPGDETRITPAFSSLNLNSHDALMRENERKELIRSLLDSLPGKQKAAFILHKMSGLSYQEIAEVLEVSLSTVEARIHRAKINLQKALISCLKKI
ncbi:MAG: RNA polymerase sigma factor [Candidatus Aminicenantes bacterium]|nr:RNA polymerase sigma factor [Candidatus Aminicenantes bacterium]